MSRQFSTRIDGRRVYACCESCGYIARFMLPPAFDPKQRQAAAVSLAMVLVGHGCIGGGA